MDACAGSYLYSFCAPVFLLILHPKHGCRRIERSLPMLGNLLRAGNADTVREAITLLTMLKKVWTCQVRPLQILLLIK
jgi:hypothetical protein